ncbi:MAG: arsenate reductase ArsC [Candidatus Fermentibacteraceae bacterium]|nr:arsenate reductase ArsC [Candidatus Fermentibacteraceae bacterium]MBN2608134.1 arsenate reductase ArsC [Candidatus Fermentibacteraceae bacterium]
MSKARVLFLCTGNSARSQMAEAFLRKQGGDSFEPVSAGLQPVPIHPLTIQVMREKGVELEEEGHRSKGLVEEFFRKQVHIGYLITVCRQAESNCPIYPWAGVREFWDIEDPAAFRGTEEEKLDCFRRVRDEIELKVRNFLERMSPDQQD